MKKSSLLLITFLTVGMFAGCGNSGNAVEPEEQYESTVSANENALAETTESMDSQSENDGKADSGNDSQTDSQTDSQGDIDEEGKYLTMEAFYAAEMTDVTLEGFLGPKKFEPFEKADTIVEVNDIYMNFYLKEGVTFTGEDYYNLVGLLLSAYPEYMKKGAISGDLKGKIQFHYTVYDCDENELYSYSAIFPKAPDEARAELQKYLEE